MSKKPLCEKKYSQPHNIDVSFETNPILKEELRTTIHQQEKRCVKGYQKLKKNSPEYKKGKLKGYKNGLSKNGNRLEKISNTIQGINILKDSIGPLIAHCSFFGHFGAIGEKRFFKEENGYSCRQCDYLIIFRPSKQNYTSK